MDNIPYLIVWGILDSLSPLHVAVWAWFVAACITISNNRKALLLFSLFFLITFYAFSLMGLVGLLNSLLLKKWYPTFSKLVYILLGTWLLWIGAKLFWRWTQEIRSPEKERHTIELKILPLANSLGIPTALFAAIIMALSLIIWAPSIFVTALATNLPYPGKLWETLALLAFYSFFKIFFLLLTLIVIFLLTKEGRVQKKPMLQLSLTYIIMAAFYIGIGSGVIFISLKNF